MSEERRLTPPPSPLPPVPRNVIFELEQRYRIITRQEQQIESLASLVAELERENRELRLTANLPPTGKVTTLVGIEPSRLRELELCERRWETCERLAEARGFTSHEWVILFKTGDLDFASAVDNASREDTTNVD